MWEEEKNLVIIRMTLFGLPPIHIHRIWDDHVYSVEFLHVTETGQKISLVIFKSNLVLDRTAELTIYKYTVNGLGLRRYTGVSTRFSEIRSREDLMRFLEAK